MCCPFKTFYEETYMRALDLNKREVYKVYNFTGHMIEQIYILYTAVLPDIMKWKKPKAPESWK